MQAPIMRASFRFVASAAMLTLAAWGCTVSKADNPSPTGPSELALSLSVLANPDTLSQDGASQSQIVFQARDVNGRPVAGLEIRADIVVDGVIQDYGVLSSKSLVTGGDGRATATYTAPPPVSGIPARSFVVIRGTPVSNDASGVLPRNVTIRLLAPGVIEPPGPTAPDFTMTPESALEDEAVTFSAANGGPEIVSYDWDFGDGSKGTGAVVQHTYGSDGNYLVTLTVTDGFGLSASRSETITVDAGAATAMYVYPPIEPFAGNTVSFKGDTLFNASGSMATTGPSIVRDTWNFGTSTGTVSGKIVTKKLSTPGIDTVTLSVRDDAGNTPTTSQEVEIL
jgi:PKD repeat protein